MRSVAIDTLSKMMQADISKCGTEAEMVGVLVESATLRVVARENVSGRRSQSSVSAGAGRISMDDTLDMIKLVIVGDSGVGKTCWRLFF